MNENEILEALGKMGKSDSNRIFILALQRHAIKFEDILSAYVWGLTRELSLKDQAIFELENVLLQLLSKTMKDLPQTTARAIYCYNRFAKESGLPSGIFNEEYHYTEEDERQATENFKERYGHE